jgi:hypothetical protein
MEIDYDSKDTKESKEVKESPIHIETSYLRLFDDQTFEVTSTIRFSTEYEHASAVVNLKFSGDNTEYYVVGTAVAIPDEPEPKLGRIIVYKVHEKKLVQVAEQPVKGSSFAILFLFELLFLTLSSSSLFRRCISTGVVPG